MIYETCTIRPFFIHTIKSKDPTFIWIHYPCSVCHLMISQSSKATLDYLLGWLCPYQISRTLLRSHGTAWIGLSTEWLEALLMSQQGAFRYSAHATSLTIRENWVAMQPEKYSLFSFSANRDDNVDVSGFIRVTNVHIRKISKGQIRKGATNTSLLIRLFKVRSHCLGPHKAT